MFLDTLLDECRRLTLREIKEQWEQLALVEQPDRAVSSIAIDVGIANESTFYRLFRTHTGATPNHYRVNQAMAREAE